MGKKYERHLVELKQVLGYIFMINGVKLMPEFLSEDLVETITDIDVSSELKIALQEYLSKKDNN